MSKIKTTRERLLERIEKHLVDNEISPTDFGRTAMSDPNFVFDIRAGRKPNTDTLDRVEAYLQQAVV